MEIGIHGGPNPQDDWFAQDLGVTWYKWGAAIDSEKVTDDRERHEQAARLGRRVCVDLRTSAAWMNGLGTVEYDRLRKAGALQSAEPRPPPPEQGDMDDDEYREVSARYERERFAAEDPVIRYNQAATHAAVLERIAENVRRHVELHKDFCQDWEWWGENDCPSTSEGIFHVICYPATLQVVHRAIKEVQPEGRVWTGGNGMDLNDNWVAGLRKDGAFKSFDVLNWHPYPMSLRDRPQIEKRLHENYSGWRQILDAEGLGQPYGCTEWGYPSLGTVGQRQREWLSSRVVAGGITQLFPEEALEAYEGDLRIMEQHGFQVVIVHILRDGPSRFWGDKCGLMAQPLKGLKGRALRAVWKRVECKPVYGVVREWAHRGAAGKKAFAQ